MLRAHWAEQEQEPGMARELWHNEGWAFASPTGEALNPNTDYHEWKRGACGRMSKINRCHIAAGQRGGGCEIRTREGLPPTRFPSVRPRPLGESSAGKLTGPAVGTGIRRRPVGPRG